MPALPDLQVQLGTDPGGALGHCSRVDSVQEHLVASVEFPSREAPLLALGQRVEVEFRSSDLERSIHTEGFTILRTDESEHRIYGFRCDISKRAFLSLLNRRRVPRVCVLPAEAPSVHVLEIGDPPPVATLRDVSMIGLSLQLDARFEPQIFERAHLELALRLPGEEDAIRITAAIRHRRLQAGAVQYGLQVVAGIAELAAGRLRFERYVSALIERVSGRTRAARQRRRSRA